MPPYRNASLGTVELRYHNPHVALVTLNSPPNNLLSWQSRGVFTSVVAELAENLDVRCVVITGAGSVFTAGADLREDQAMTEDQLPDLVADFERVIHGIEEFRAPVIAAINGPAIGGGLEFALACDIRITAQEAFFVAAGVNVGLIANFWRLSRTIGLGPAKEMLLTGGRYSAEQALGWGLVSEVHPASELLRAALAKAELIASKAPLSVEHSKECANLAAELGKDAALALQQQRFLALFHTADHLEALSAFFDGRSGDYQRR